MSGETISSFLNSIQALASQIWSEYTAIVILGAVMLIGTAACVVRR